MNKRSVGGRYEAKAATYLIEMGLTILDRNFRCRFGEIDLIAMESGRELAVDHDQTIAFIEVKYRKDAKSGRPFEAVDHKKQKTICRVADYYRLKHNGLTGYNFRFDVISILGDEITWIKNAFPYTV